jgi:hypothetical protein
VQRAAVGEVPMGTSLREVIDEIGGGARPGRRIVAAMSGVANPIVPETAFDTPLTYEDMAEIGSGLGAAGFLVFDDATDMVEIAHGVSRFLAVESCGQCTPCKQDGLAIAELLDRVRTSDTDASTMEDIQDHLRTVTDSARCFLAHQHQRVVSSIIVEFPDAFARDAARPVGDAGSNASEGLIASIRAIDDGEAVLDESQRTKQPDWTHDPIDSGKAPAERLETPAEFPARAPVIPPRHLPPDLRRPMHVGSADERRAPHEVPPRPVHGIPVDAVDPDDPEARLYTSEPIETDQGTIVIQQQATGADNVEGGGEFPDPHTRPQRPAPGAE